MQSPLTPRNLTHDEKKAAEAAFRGLPFDPNWSAAARSVYEGILNTSRGGANAVASSPGHESEPKETQAEPIETVPSSSLRGALPILGAGDQAAGKIETSQQLVGTREEAIQAGLLIDVSPLARSLGLPLLVGVTKPLWDLVITASQAVPDEQHESRMRDLLLALRLRLATSRTTIPLIEFPALLTFPPETIPQFCVLHAVAHGDLSNVPSLTLALRDEVSLIISPLNN